jgi:hypothetical protein
MNGIDQMQLGLADTARHAADEVLREMGVRTRVYPKLVADGRLGDSEAKRRLECMEQAWTLLRAIQTGHLVHRPTVKG